MIERTLSYLGGVVRGRESADQLGGPIRIAQVSGEAAQAGIPALFLLAAVLSVYADKLNRSFSMAADFRHGKLNVNCLMPSENPLC